MDDLHLMQPKDEWRLGLQRYAASPSDVIRCRVKLHLRPLKHLAVDIYVLMGLELDLWQRFDVE